MLCVHSEADDYIASARSGAFEEFVNQSLVGLRSFRCEAAQTSQQRRRNANRDELFGIAGLGTADAARALELFVRGSRDIREINAAVRNTPCALYDWLGAR